MFGGCGDAPQELVFATQAENLNSKLTGRIHVYVIDSSRSGHYKLQTARRLEYLAGNAKTESNYQRVEILYSGRQVGLTHNLFNQVASLCQNRASLGGVILRLCIQNSRGHARLSFHARSNTSAIIRSRSSSSSPSHSLGITYAFFLRAITVLCSRSTDLRTAYIEPLR